MKEQSNDDGQSVIIGKGIFLGMNSEGQYVMYWYASFNYELDSFEVFAKVLFQSKSTKEVDTDVDLPQPSNRGEYNFHDLEVGSSIHIVLSHIAIFQSGDIFLWKASRLQPMKSRKSEVASIRSNSKSTKDHRYACVFI